MQKHVFEPSLERYVDFFIRGYRFMAKVVGGRVRSTADIKCVELDHDWVVDNREVLIELNEWLEGQDCE